MKNGNKVIKWIIENIKWVFSGIGVTVLVALAPCLFTGHTDGKDGMSDNADIIKDTNNIEVTGNVFHDSIINNYNASGNGVQVADMPERIPQNKENGVKNELVIDVDGNKIYPISIDVKDEQKVGDWIYFRYMLTEPGVDETITYPALFRYQEDIGVAERVNEQACYSYEVVGDCVYYLDSLKDFQDHGVLYVSRPDGKNERILDDELYNFQIVDERYIYYTYRHDTLGVGLEARGLQRMNLDGSEKMIVAYDVSGLDMNASHFSYKVENGWIDCGTFKMEVGEPADGYEKIVFKNIGDNDWVYYTTNRLIKARKDGSERMELDGVESYYYEIEKIEDDWIYYIKGVEEYRIRTDGSGKEVITEGLGGR